MKIIVAPNNFKHSLSALEAALAIQRGLEAGGLNNCSEIFPIADGGEGFTEILVKQMQGGFIPVPAKDPLDRDIIAYYGDVGNGTAVVELAAASGMKWLKSGEEDVMRASTYGTGMLLCEALNKGFRKFIIGMGNSATVDGGMGLMRALGVKFTDGEGKEIRYAHELPQLQATDVSRLDPKWNDCSVTIACDVTNTLLGPDGAARIFGPQKGADPQQVKLLESGLEQLRLVLRKTTGKDVQIPYAGAAGGTSAILYALLNARLTPGIDLLMDVTGFRDTVRSASLLITAEGSIDEQTLGNKGPYGVARAAKERGVPVIALAGRIPQHLDLSKFEAFDAVFPIGTGPVPLAEALTNTRSNLERTATQLAKLLRLRMMG